jgi:hypothetical protein
MKVATAPTIVNESHLLARKGWQAEGADGSEQAGDVERRATDVTHKDLYKDLLCGAEGAFGRDQCGVHLQRVTSDSDAPHSC